MFVTRHASITALAGRLPIVHKAVISLETPIIGLFDGALGKSGRA
jgi:hypothetical protein